MKPGAAKTDDGVVSSAFPVYCRGRRLLQSSQSANVSRGVRSMDALMISLVAALSVQGFSWRQIRQARNRCFKTLNYDQLEEAAYRFDE